MFVVCRGFSVFVDMLEPDILYVEELPMMALEGIHKLLVVDNQRHKRYFCRHFASGGLLRRIIDGISCSVKQIEGLFPNGIGDSDNKIRNTLLKHITDLSSLVETFAARADPTVKARMTPGCVLQTMVKLIRNRSMPKPAVQLI